MTSLPASVSPAGPDLDGIESAVAVGERATTDDTRRKDRI